MRSSGTGRRAEARLVCAGPNWSSICGDPGSASLARMRSRITGNLQRLGVQAGRHPTVAAWASTRCSAWPARSQSSWVSPVVTRPRSRPEAARPARGRAAGHGAGRGRSHAAPSVPGMAGPAGPNAAAGTPSLAALPGGRLQRQIAARAPALRACILVASAARADSFPYWLAVSMTASVAPSASASCCRPGQQPGRQRAWVERTAVGVPVRECRQHPAFRLGDRRLRAEGHPGQQPGLGLVGKQASPRAGSPARAPRAGARTVPRHRRSASPGRRGPGRACAPGPRTGRSRAGRPRTATAGCCAPRARGRRWPASP